jgi:glutamate-1-semialdehyde 2,1-aminomutase
VVEAAKAALDRGAVMSAEMEDTYKVAAKIKKMVPCAEKVKFAVGGTDATEDTIRIARGFTGRDKIIKFEGAYHGSHGSVLVSVKPTLEQAGPADHPNRVPASAGIPADTIKNAKILPPQQR